MGGQYRSPTEVIMSSTDVSTNSSTDGVPTYLGGGDPAGRFTDYYPAWLDNLADDVTVEGSLLDGAVQGADAVRTIIGAIRTLYDRQEFNFAGPWGDNSFLEDYTAKGPRRTNRLYRPGHTQRGRADPARRGELPATQFAAALVPPAGREVRRHPHRRAFPRRRGLKPTTGFESLSRKASEAGA
jgi:hypothetical protein